MLAILVERTTKSSEILELDVRKLEGQVTSFFEGKNTAKPTKINSCFLLFFFNWLLVNGLPVRLLLLIDYL
jgi:hypothetical protein